MATVHFIGTFSVVVIIEVAFYCIVNFIGTCSVVCIALVAFYALLNALVHVPS